MTFQPPGRTRKDALQRCCVSPYVLRRREAGLVFLWKPKGNTGCKDMLTQTFLVISFKCCWIEWQPAAPMEQELVGGVETGLCGFSCVLQAVEHKGFHSMFG